MDASQIYIVIAVAVLLIVGGVVFFVRRKKKERLSRLAAVAFAFILAGIAFGENRLVGYGLMGIGVIIAIVDIILKRK